MKWKLKYHLNIHQLQKKDLIDTLMELSDDTKNAIKTVFCGATIEDSVYQLNPYDF